MHTEACPSLSLGSSPRGSSALLQACKNLAVPSAALIERPCPDTDLTRAAFCKVRDSSIASLALCATPP